MGLKVENDNEKINIVQVLNDNLSQKRIGETPEKLTPETFTLCRLGFKEVMDEGSKLKKYEEMIPAALDKVANANFDNFDANSLDSGTLTTLKRIFGDDDDAGEAKQEAVSYETYNVLRSLMEAIQANDAGKGGDGGSGGNNGNGSANTKLVNKYLNGLKSMAKAKIKIMQAYVNFMCALTTLCYGVFEVAAESVYTDEYNKAIGGKANNKPVDNNPADANQQNNNQQQNNNNQNNGNK